MTAFIRPNDSAEAGVAVAQALEAAGFSYALGGALALGAHGVPRGTLDVDVNVFCQEHEIPLLVERLRDLGIELDRLSSSNFGLSGRIELNPTILDGSAKIWGFYRPGHHEIHRPLKQLL
jgi:hypothetical protein